MGSPVTEFPPKFMLGRKNQKEFPKQIRAALEEHGCFLLKSDEHDYFSNEMVEAMESLYGLNSETKIKIPSESPYNAYIGPYVSPNEVLPYYEAFSVVPSDEEVKKLADRCWPNGNEKFRQTLSSTNKDLLEIGRSIMDIVATSYGLDNEDSSCFSNLNSICRITKYYPPTKGETQLGLPPHVDAFYLTVLCQNGVNGLQIKSKDDNWYDVDFEKGSLLIIAGSLLQAWSNGKLNAAVHKVMIGGDKERYSYTIFLVPELDDVVKPPSELIDDEKPSRFRPFHYKDFLSYSTSKYSREGVVEEFAGI